MHLSLTGNLRRELKLILPCHRKTPRFRGVFFYGGPSEARTHDTRLKRPLLYRLSYGPLYETNLRFFSSVSRHSRLFAGAKSKLTCSFPLEQQRPWEGKLTPYIIYILAKKSTEVSPSGLRISEYYTLFIKINFYDKYLIFYV